MSRVEIAELVLEYVKVLAWPMVVGVALWRFAPQLRGLIARLQEARWGPAQAKFAEAARDAEEASLTVREALTQQVIVDSAIDLASGEGSPATSGEPFKKVATPEELEPSPAGLETGLRREMASALQQLQAGPDFDTPRELNEISPDAAVLLAFREVEDIARAALTATATDRPPGLHGARLIKAAVPGGGDTDALIDNLARLRNSAAHSPSPGASRQGADDYINACMNVSLSILSVAWSRLRHPAHAALVAEIAEHLGLAPEDLVPRR